jgi:hypothetical protein
LIAPSWPLQRWGIDIVGKLTPAQGNYTFTIVAVEYFTKWVKAKPVMNTTSTTIQKFFWQNIIYFYEDPQQIHIDNAKYFDSIMFKDFCHQIRTKVSFASIYHPQSNMAVERANTLIFEAIKKILKSEKKDKWAEVMPRAVWSHNITIYRGTNCNLGVCRTTLKCDLRRIVQQSHSTAQRIGSLATDISCFLQVHPAIELVSIPPAHPLVRHNRGTP